MDLEDGSATVWIDGLFHDAAGTKFELSAPPAELIRLRLPAHGSVEVRLRYSDGKPYAGTASIELDALDETIAFAGDSRRQVAIGESRAKFALVGLGYELRATARLGEREAEVEVVGPGPRAAGESAILDLTLDPAQVVGDGPAR